MVVFVHEGAPVSKSRARWNRKQGRFYTPEKTQTAEEAMSWSFTTAVRERPWSGNVALAAVFFRPNQQRIDADNLMKLVLDAGTKAGAWSDDSQVTHQVSVIELDAARPRTVVALAPVTSTLDRGRDIELICEICKEPFIRDRILLARRRPKVCSKICLQTLRASKLTTARCARCGTKFQRRKAAQRYCSHPCALSHEGLLRRREPSKCQVCGEAVSRPEYLNCNRCRRKGRKPGSKNLPKVTP